MTNDGFTSLPQLPREQKPPPPCGMPKITPKIAAANAAPECRKGTQNEVEILPKSLRKRMPEETCRKNQKSMHVHAPPGAPDLDFCWPLQYETLFCESRLSPFPCASGLRRVMKMSSKSHENRSPGRPKKHAENIIE